MSRIVRICTLSMDTQIDAAAGSSKEKMRRAAQEKLALGRLDRPDLFVLPEAFLVRKWGDPDNVEEPGNDIYQWLSETARLYKAYIVAPLIIREAERLYNAAVLFDRQGTVAYVYRKIHLPPEELAAGLTPGSENPSCFDADFGRLGIAICFDLHFQPLFRHYYSQGMELLVFPTYFPGWQELQVWAYLYMFHAVSSHARGSESMFVNNLGSVEAVANPHYPVLTRAIELDSVVVPYYVNRMAIQEARAQYGTDLEVVIHPKDGASIIRYRGTETTARAILDEFAIRTRAAYYQGQHLL